MELPESSNWENFKMLLDNMEFWFICFGLTGLFFVVTGIQYWLPTYLQKIYGKGKDEAAVLYTVISITGPIIGVIAGGLLTTYFGGYNSIKG